MQTHKTIQVPKAETVGSAPKVGDKGRFVDETPNGSWSLETGWVNTIQDTDLLVNLLRPEQAQLLKDLKKV